MKISTNHFISATVNLEVPFFDIDSMGVVWHGNYIKYFEIGRCELLKKINYDYNDMQASGYAWPVVDMRVKYIKPLIFRQEITIAAFLVEYENRLKIEYLITDKNTQQKFTVAYSIQVAVDAKTRKICFASPDILLNKVREVL